MPTKFRHLVTDKNGKEHRRVSVNHQYAFAVVAHYPERTRRTANGELFTAPARSEASWSKQRHLAAQYERDRIRGGAESVEILDAKIQMIGRRDP